jgi:GTP-binding protein Era
MKSGFVSFVGRPNVGKSTLLNRILGTKVAITSDKPQTTRTRILGVLTRPDSQVVFVDTPGIHKPRTALGTRLNATAQGTINDVDVVCFVLDATQPFGRGDQWVANLVPQDAVCIVNKVDKASKKEVADQLVAASGLSLSEYFPDDMVTDVPEAFMVAELVREQLLRRTHDELPHSIAARVTEWDWPLVRCEILVERSSQKGIVIGHKGQVLKEVGIAVREQLPEGTYLELIVKVDKDWQSRPKAMERFGY